MLYKNKKTGEIVAILKSVNVSYYGVQELRAFFDFLNINATCNNKGFDRETKKFLIRVKYKDLLMVFRDGDHLIVSSTNGIGFLSSNKSIFDVFEGFSFDSIDLYEKK